MKRTVLPFVVVVSSILAVAGVAFGLQPHLFSLALKHLALGAFSEGTACVGDNQCTSGHCRLVMPDAGPGSAAQCCSMGGESCSGTNTCCAESELACNAGTCCQSAVNQFCEKDIDCCINSGQPANGVDQCHNNLCRWCIPSGFSQGGSTCCSGQNNGGTCCAPRGSTCTTYPDGGSDVCPGLVCGPTGTAAQLDFTQCTSSTQCASGTCVDAGTVDAGCGGPC